MDLYKEWQKIQEEKFNSISINKDKIMHAIYQDSNSTISQLRTRLKYKRNWIILFIAFGFIWAVYSIKNTDMLIIIGVLIALYFIGFVGISYFVRSMNKEINYSEETLSLMKINLSLINNSLKFENLWGLVAFPMALIAGVTVPYISKGASIISLSSNTTLLLTVPGLICVVVPIMFLLTHKMNKIGYGTLINQLQKNIHQMELLEE
ncbi:MAG: hypothetical protein ACJA01_003291 [Saprospiraceae bacterium]|jgi:hypothetical protein